MATTLASSIVSAAAGDSQAIVPLTSAVAKPLNFSDFDTDGNNLLSIEETQKNDLLHSAFSQIDANGDANIDQDEFADFINNM